MNEENFMKNIGWLNSLKLRVGYGVTGNASINSYQTAGSMVSQWANKPFGQVESRLIRLVLKPRYCLIVI